MKGSQGIYRERERDRDEGREGGKERGGRERERERREICAHHQLHTPQRTSR